MLIHKIKSTVIVEFVILMIALFDMNSAMATAAEHECEKSEHAIDLGMSLDQIYHQAQLQFRRANYPATLCLAKGYITRSKKKPDSTEKLIALIDKVGFIYLRIQHDPEKAALFFKNIQNKFVFSDEVSNIIDEWLGAAIEWKKFGTYPKTVKKPDKLFLLGQTYFDKGTSHLQYPMDKSGNANFHIAASYLIPFIANNDSHPKLPEALLMMGKIRRHIVFDQNYWSENFYFKEAIRRFPHTKIAAEAYTALEESVHFAYSGSAGDSTPPSMLEMLKRYRKLAYSN